MPWTDSITGSNAIAGSPTAKPQDTIGNPLASGLVEQMVQEVKDGLKTRGIDRNFAAFQSYLGSQLDATAGLRASEVTGNCRLRWYDRMLRDPLKATVEAERFTRELHQALQGDHKGLDRALAIARDKMDAGHREPRKFPAVTSPEQALETLRQGMGFARDFGGNDRRYGGTQSAYDGGPRIEPMFDRFTCGFGCHYALGFCFDDEGDDTYGGTIMGLGFAWDCSVGVLCDFAGNDRYEAAGGDTQGNGVQAGLGILFDYGGNDTYLGYSQGWALPSISTIRSRGAAAISAF